jgi:hypothetical protein
MLDDTIEDKIIKIAQNYAPHHDELRAGDTAWFAMGVICGLLGIKTGDPENPATLGYDSVDSEGNPCIEVDDDHEDARPSGHRGEDFHSDG